MRQMDARYAGMWCSAQSLAALEAFCLVRLVLASSEQRSLILPCVLSIGNCCFAADLHGNPLPCSCLVLPPTRQPLQYTQNGPGYAHETGWHAEAALLQEHQILLVKATVVAVQDTTWASRAG